MPVITFLPCLNMNELYRMQDKINLLLVIIFLGIAQTAIAQKTKAPKNAGVEVIVKNGVLHWVADGKEVALFGVNYTAPFAYAYRAIAKTGISHEEAIRNDVYHFARLGFDAFRVHVWDTEISDTAGNLLANEHLRLFDFLLAELKRYKIKAIVTPIAFWGNGYPEPDENTPGFSRHYGKGKATLNDTAIRAQENYLRQFFNHVNPYTGLTYLKDADIIATEINNEPTHSGPAKGVTDYINRLHDAIRSTGWTKPIFYNISENPRYASATTASKADGYSFQWYPSGLVSGKTLQSNYLPHVDEYHIPFGDSLPAFNNKPLMVYEFDPADILNPIMYPAMARSFRVAGFQWATQFAYDPMPIAHANTEYQTHYLNLAYTPAKAISMLIAGEVFRSTPRKAKMDKYPSDSAFGPFLISFRQSLSQMNSDEKFYYSGHTSSQPGNPSALKHVAGVGNSPIVQYSGSGAYFLDKINEGVWRLEVMPDATFLNDPFAKSSPARTVSAIHWKQHPMRIQLPSLGRGFSVKGINKGNDFKTVAETDSFSITPGTYILYAGNKSEIQTTAYAGLLPLEGFVAPPASNPGITIRHDCPETIPPGKPFSIRATLAGADPAKVFLLLSKPGWGRPLSIAMVPVEPYTFSGEIPADMAIPGILQYRIMVQKGDDFTSFPGNVKGNPQAWDYLDGGKWEIVIKSPEADLTLFNAATDRSPILYPAWGRGIQQGFMPLNTGSGFGYLFQGNQWPNEEVVGLQYAVQNKILQIDSAGLPYSKVVIKARTFSNNPVRAKLVLVSKDAIAYVSSFELSGQTKEIVLPLAGFSSGRYLLLPRPYPGFHPLWFGAATGTVNTPLLNTGDLDLLQFIIEKQDNPALSASGPSFEIEWISLRK